MFLNDRPGISGRTRAVIEAAINELGYVPRQDKRRHPSNGFVGLVVEKLPLTLRGDYFYAAVADGIQHEAERLGYSLAISVLNQPQTDLPRLIDEQQVVGVLAIGGGDVTDHLLERIAERNMPLVTVDNDSLLRPLNSVVVDNQRGAYLATRHLIELGHRWIAVIRGPAKYKSLTERFYGYIQALVDAGITPDPRLIQPAISQGIPRKGRLEMQQLLRLDPRPTAVFAVSDRTALGAMDALQEAGLSVPDDISMVGFDDMPPEAYAHVALTSVTSRRDEMGRTAVQRLHALVQDPTLPPVKIVMHTQLVYRDSVAPPG